MNEYTPNSHKYRDEQRSTSQEERKIEKVIKGTAKIKKKSEFSKLADVFISEDVKNVKSFILMDILVPTVKKAILSTIDMILNGGGGSYDYSRGSSGSKVSYRKYYDDRRDERRYEDNSRSKTRFDYNDIMFESRGEAEAVREQMFEVIERYGFVTVADLYDMADLTQPYTSNRYGWTNIRNSEVVRVSGGYIIKLPKVMTID